MLSSLSRDDDEQDDVCDSTAGISVFHETAVCSDLGNSKGMKNRMKHESVMQEEMLDSTSSS